MVKSANYNTVNLTICIHTCTCIHAYLGNKGGLSGLHLRQQLLSLALHILQPLLIVRLHSLDGLRDRERSSREGMEKKLKRLYIHDILSQTCAHTSVYMYTKYMYMCTQTSLAYQKQTGFNYFLYADSKAKQHNTTLYSTSDLLGPEPTAVCSRHTLYALLTELPRQLN